MSTAAPAPPFEARSLVKRFGRFTALDRVSLSVGTGEILALFGRNGAGKTTVLHLAATLMKPSEGELFYEGRPASSAPRELRRSVGMVSHASFLYPDLTVRENLEFFSRLYGLRDRGARIKEAIARADLTVRADSPVRSLSRGMHQRLTIARALLHAPLVLLLDEPYTGLDPASAERFTRQLSELRETGTAAILTTHDLERGLEVADRVALLESGRLVYEGPGGQDLEEFRKLFAKLTGK
ncbi:MAG: heme ABC exporter ATP-binding protein CcmA [Acidobacteriota bacterium]